MFIFRLRKDKHEEQVDTEGTGYCKLSWEGVLVFVSRFFFGGVVAGDGALVMVMVKFIGNFLA
jgi:hypothetical protein